MRLKSLMLLPIIIALSLIMGYGLFQILTQGFSLGRLGLVLAAVPLPAFISFVMATGSMARTSENLPGALLVSGIGVVLTIVSAADAIISSLALASGAALLWYVFVYSRYGRGHSATMALGGKLPDFVLEDPEGQEVHSETFRAQPTLLLFYRGNWCPLCMAQIKEVAAAYKRLSAMGVEVALVSPQPAKESAALAAKFDVPFRFLVDKDHKAAQALDIFAKGGTPAGLDVMGYGEDTVLPTVIATDKTGTIIFLDETDNYRVRPEPETFLSIFEGKPLPPALQEATI